MPPAEVSVDDVRASLEVLGTVKYAVQSINLYRGREEEVHDFLKKFMNAYRSFEFRGLPHMTEKKSQIALDAANTGFWKDSDTLDWKVTPTGLNTFDAFFPESSTQTIRLDTQTAPHWAMLLGFLEVGAASNLVRLNPRDVNGSPRGRTSISQVDRLGDYKLIPLSPAYRFEDRGTFAFDFEAETATPVEVIPLATHIASYEIFRAQWSAYVTAG